MLFDFPNFVFTKSVGAYCTHRPTPKGSGLPVQERRQAVRPTLFLQHRPDSSSSGFLGLICFCVNLPDSLELSERYLTDTKADVPIRYLLLLFRLYLYCFLLSYYLSQHIVPLSSEQCDVALQEEEEELRDYI